MKHFAKLPSNFHFRIIECQKTVVKEGSLHRQRRSSRSVEKGIMKQKGIAKSAHIATNKSLAICASTSRITHLVGIFGVHAVAEEGAVEHVDVLPRGLRPVDRWHVPAADGRRTQARGVLKFEPHL